MTTLAEIAPTFVEIAHRIVWVGVATVDTAGRPRTRVLHPVWEWDGEQLVGWIATDPTSLKAKHLARQPRVSMTYWDAQHDHVTADCETSWRN
ncbi:MAG TPA: pyridoxamine 5'-phosphate oxidase family protein, partial [Acidimicrobiales bacterium]|nr:pyridoxamine 5'-phosphate oxidase family protein [Acidimicrobiales bacterium]